MVQSLSNAGGEGLEVYFFGGDYMVFRMNRGGSVGSDRIQKGGTSKIDCQ